MFEDIVETADFSEMAVEYVKPAATAIATRLVSSLFLRKGTERKVLESSKADYFTDLAESLIENGHMTNLEYYKTRNFLTIAERADEVRSADNKQGRAADCEEDSGCYDFDWFVRFFEAAGNISDKDMQGLWAKVLSGEVSKPGRFSLRTLETLRNLSREEAKEFECLAACVVIDGCGQLSVPSSLDFMPDVNKCYGFSASSLNRMSDCGLLLGSKSECRMFDNEKDEYCLSNKNTVAVFAPAPSSFWHDLSFDTYPLSRAGKELLFVLGGLLNRNYIQDFVFAYKLAMGDSVKVTVHELLEETDLNEVNEYNEYDISSTYSPVSANVVREIETFRASNPSEECV